MTSLHRPSYTMKPVANRGNAQLTIGCDGGTNKLAQPKVDLENSDAVEYTSSHITSVSEASDDNAVGHPERHLCVHSEDDEGNAHVDTAMRFCKDNADHFEQLASYLGSSKPGFQDYLYPLGERAKVTEKGSHADLAIVVAYDPKGSNEDQDGNSRAKLYFTIAERGGGIWDAGLADISLKGATIQAEETVAFAYSNSQPNAMDMPLQERRKLANAACAKLKATSAEDMRLLPPEPMNFEQVNNLPDSNPEKHLWIMAMLDELKVLHETTKTLKPLKGSRKMSKQKLKDLGYGAIITSKFVLKRKLFPTGGYDRHKARLTARGFTEIWGQHYVESFSATASPNSFKVLTSLAMYMRVKYGKCFRRTADCKSAFLMSGLDKPVLMKLPEGITIEGEPYVIVDKALYGFHSSASLWLKLLTEEVLKLDARYKKCEVDTCLFVLHDPKEKLFVLMCVHVDDIYAISSDEAFLDQHLKQLDSRLAARGGGVTVQKDASQYVGVTITEIDGDFYFSGQKHRQTLLDNWDDGKCPSRTTPYPVGVKIRPLKTEEDKRAHAIECAVNSFVGLARYMNRYDLRVTYVVAALSVVQDAPTAEAEKVIRHATGFIRANPNYALRFRKLPKDLTAILLEGYADVSYACCPVTCRSLGSSLVMMNGHVIMHNASWIKRVVTSTTQGELFCVSKVCKDVLFIKGLLDTFGLEYQMPIPLWCDSTAAIFLSENNTLNERTRHFAIDELFVREHVANGTMMPKFCRTDQQLADYFNKAHSAVRCTICSTIN